MNALYTTNIDVDCLQLFNDLCEHKALLPLAYLLHTWPITGFTDISLHRLHKTLEAVAALSDADLVPTSRERCKKLILKLERCGYRSVYG